MYVRIPCQESILSKAEQIKLGEPGESRALFFRLSTSVAKDREEE
jgi:hypothetical protein